MSARSTGAIGRRTRWAAGVVLVLGLVVLAVLVVVGAAGRQQADDPRSSTPGGAGALGALLAAEGVRVTTTQQVDTAAAAADPARTLVVANADRLEEAAARRLLTAGWDRVILLRPNTPALTRFGVRASARSARAGSPLAPNCPVEAAQRAGTIAVAGLRASYIATGPAQFACYPTADGHTYLGVGTADGAPVELVGGGVANSELAADGNAAFALNVFGARAEITWLMARTEPPSGATRSPSLLPPWWPIALAQCAVAFVVVAIWRGRRLGPILTEPIPVRIRAAETVEGHGRLYHRLTARDRAAEALRAGATARLSRAFGHAEDPLALSAAVGNRTGRDPGEVRRLLFEAVPASDDDLVNLARHLDRLEQEARRL